MKVFLVACLAVAVMAESDPNLILAPGMFHSGIYNPGLVSPISYIQPQVQVVAKDQEQKVVSPIATSYISPFYTSLVNPIQKVVVGPKIVQKNGEVESILHKRDADADPALMYYYNLHGLSPFGYPAFRSVFAPRVAVANKATFINPFTGVVTGKVTNDAILPTNYANKGQVFARAPGTNTIHIAKRDADPLTVITNPLTYNGALVNRVVNPIVSSQYLLNQPLVSSQYLVNQPLVSSVNPAAVSSVYTQYTHPVVNSVNPVVYSNPAVVAKTVAKPIVQNAALGMEGVLDGKTVADDAWQFTPNYAGKGMVEHRTPGTVHRARRDADPLTVIRSGLLRSYYPGFVGSPVVRSSVVNPYYTRQFTTPLLRYY